MTDIRLDPLTGDVAIVSGDLDLVEDAEAIRQHLQIRLKMFRGEWFRNVEEGMPYFQNILKKIPTTQSVAGIFREAILDTPGVVQVESIRTNLDASTRVLSLSFKARIQTDEVLVFEEFIIDV